MRKRKYFVTSDVHSYLKPLKRALSAAGWNQGTKSHVLVVLGDIFDRGDETIGVYHFIRSIPKDRRVLVKGNHEELFLDLLKKDVPDSYDYSNGTVKTMCQIAGVPDGYMNGTKLLWDFLDGAAPVGEYDNAQDYVCQTLHSRFGEIKALVNDSGIPDWLRSDEWVDYFELGDYVMVHSFIPLREPKAKMSDYYSSKEYFPEWRTDATAKEWSDARWGCPYRQYDDGLFKEPGKTLVCGHWHAFDFRSHYEGTTYNEYDIIYDKSIHDIYRHDGIMALDACTSMSDKVNVLKIEE